MKLYDTCSLLELQQTIFEEQFYISSITLTELEQIKSSGVKDEERKYAARQILHLLKLNEDKYIVVNYDSKLDETIIKRFSLLLNNDSRIIATAYTLFYDAGSDIKFITSDLAAYSIARSLEIPSELTEDADKDDYTGYKEIQMDDTELAKFYNDIYQNHKNIYKLQNNEYLLIRDNSNKIVDKYKWCNGKYTIVPYNTLKTTYFGEISPQDDYQQLAIDSLLNNEITVLRGKAGSGKSYLGLGYLMYLLEKGKIDKIIIFANTVAVRGAAKLGFYPGSKDEKLLDSQIGNFLVSKLGSISEVEKMICNGSLMLVPTADCRGMDTTGMNAGILVTEAQNFSRDMIKLVLQRLGEDSVAIIEGDDKAQLDMREYAGVNNGLKAVSRAFRGEDIYGEVTLNCIHRSRIAKVADKI